MRLYLVGLLGVLALIGVRTQKEQEPISTDASTDVQPASNASEDTTKAPVAKETTKGKGKQARVKGEPASGNRTKTPRGGANRKGGKGRRRMRGRPRERLPTGNGTAPAAKRRPTTTTEAPQPDSHVVVVGPDGQPVELKNVTALDTSGGIIRRKKGGKNTGKKTTTAAPPA